MTTLAQAATWTQVALAAIATVQVIALAWIGSRVVQHGRRLDNDERQLAQLDRRQP